MDDMKYWIWLSRIKGVGNKSMIKLLNQYKTPENIWNLNKRELMKIYGVGENMSEKILDPIYKENLDKYIEYMKKNNIGLLNLYSKEYPEKLKQIYDPPICLYIMGNKEILNDFGIAVIGCRVCTKYGEDISKKLAFNLGKHNINVISGLARGIDTYSHIGCMTGGGKTIAVVGNGLDMVYPSENKKVFDNILNTGGTIISEYVIGTKPEKMNFPARNRIISGLSDGVLVVEARNKSGSMITVDFALEQGKNVFVVPGNIDSKNSEGTNELIKQGSKLVTGIEDIIEEYH